MCFSVLGEKHVSTQELKRSNHISFHVHDMIAVTQLGGHNIALVLEHEGPQGGR